LILVDEKGKVS